MPNSKRRNNREKDNGTFFQKLNWLYQEWIICFGWEKQTQWPYLRLRPVTLDDPGTGGPLR
jgi:hypothetical protein